MSRWTSRVAAWLVLSAAALAVAGGGDAARPIEGWGRPEDPLGDCRIALEGKTLVFEVPGKLHDLAAEQGVVNAPMVLTDVERDFIADVRVAKPGRVDGETTSGYSLPYHGTGLLLWKDRDNYVRFERGNILRNRQIVHFVSFEQRANGNRVGGLVVPCQDGPIRLRLEKRGDRLLGAASVDGAAWSYVAPMSLVGDGKWKVGVTAVNSASVPYRPELEDFVLFEARAPEKASPPARPGT